MRGTGMHDRGRRCSCLTTLLARLHHCTSSYLSCLRILNPCYILYFLCMPNMETSALFPG
jgi:hypothetical protein